MLTKALCNSPASPLPSRHSNDYPFPAPPAFVSDRATRKIDKMFEERNCSRIIILDRELHVLSDHVQSTTPRPYKDATLIKLAHTQAEVETSVFRDLEQEINLHVKGGVAIVTSDGWRLLVLLQHALELGLREKTLGQEVVHKMGERLQWDASVSMRTECNTSRCVDLSYRLSAATNRARPTLDIRSRPESCAEIKVSITSVSGSRCEFLSRWHLAAFFCSRLSFRVCC